MSGTDYYLVLGVARTASDDKIKAAYRRQARKFHPDVTDDNKELEKRFKEITKAYQVLSDPQLRRSFDHSFDPVTTVTKAFTDHATGQLILDLMLPTTKASSRRGVDLLSVVKVDQELLEQGGALMIQLPIRHESQSQTEVLVDVPVKTEPNKMLKFPGFGSPGYNGGQDGDLFVLFLPQVS